MKNNVVKCAICGRLMIDEGSDVYEFDGEYYCLQCVHNDFVECERCGQLIPRDDAYRGLNGFLCDCCYDELYG